MSKPQVGGYEFNQEVNHIRNAANEINESLNAILKGSLGLQMPWSSQRIWQPAGQNLNK